MRALEDSLAYDTWDNEIQNGSFESSLDALRDVVARLESGQLPLDDAVRCYELGAKLAWRCKRLLDEAELRISRIDDELDGAVSLFGERLT